MEMRRPWQDFAEVWLSTGETRLLKCLVTSIFIHWKDQVSWSDLRFFLTGYDTVGLIPALSSAGKWKFSSDFPDEADKSFHAVCLVFPCPCPTPAYVDDFFSIIDLRGKKVNLFGRWAKKFHYTHAELNVPASQLEPESRLLGSCSWSLMYLLQLFFSSSFYFKFWIFSDSWRIPFAFICWYIYIQTLSCR